MPLSDREQQHLEWLAMVGRAPEEVRAMLEPYPNYTCYRYKKAHCKIAFYGFDGTLEAPELYFDLMQGRDSIFPGLGVKHINHRLVTRCDCGQYEDATREQVENAQQRYTNAVMRHQRARGRRPN